MADFIGPDFLIVGAPKSGTTAVHYYLSQHPNVQLSPKEIHYFGKDLGYKSPRPSLDYYQSFFDKQKINGDASVWYLYSESIIEEIKALPQIPKIIILLRDPVEMMHALHSQNLFDGNENEKDFFSAIQLESKRIKQGTPDFINPPRTVFYQKAAEYHPHIARWIEHLGTENIFIGFYEDFKKSPEELLLKIQKFIGIEPYTDIDFSPVNKNRNIKNQELHHQIKNASNWKRTLIRICIPHKPWRAKLIHYIFEKNFEEKKRKPLDHEIKKQLYDQLKPSIKALENVLKMKIEKWHH